MPLKSVPKLFLVTFDKYLKSTIFYTPIFVDRGSETQIQVDEN